LKQSTALFIVAALVLVWFGAETFPGQEICAMGCVSLKGMNVAEQIVAVVILPIILAIIGLNLRRTGKDKNLNLGESEQVKTQPQDKSGTDSSQAPSQNNTSQDKP
jgi:membrane protein implicated in regulation of membrane protease activity